MTQSTEDQFSLAIPRGITGIVRTAAGLLSAWVENGYTMRVTRNATNDAVALVATKRGKATLQLIITRNSVGTVVGLNGDSIKSVLLGQVLASAAATLPLGAAAVSISPLTGVLEAGGAVIGQRQAVGNNLCFPLYYQTDTNTVRNMARRHAVAGHGKWTDIKATYCGFTFAANVEAAITAPFTLRSALEYGGTTYPMLFSGARDVVIAAGITYVTSDIISGLSINGGFVMERLRTISNAASDNILIVGEYDPAYGEWVYSGTDTAVDYTLSGEPGKGAMGSFTINGSGTITAITHAVAGSGYTGANCTIYAFDPDAPTHTVDLIANRALSGGAVTLGTQTTGIVNAAGPSGGGVWGPNTFPVYRPAGLTANSRIYGATIISGVSSTGTRSVIMVVDSNGSYGAGPTVPDGLMARSIYERAIGTRSGVVTFGCPGWTAAAAATEATTPNCHAVLNLLDRPDVIVQVSGNDMSSALGTIQASVQSIAAQWRARGCRVSYATSLPRTTGTFTSAAGQTITSTYGVGEMLDQFNASVRGGYNGMAGDFGYFEAFSAAAPADYVKTGTATYNPASLADGEGATTTVTVTGAALGDRATATFSLDLQGIVLTAYVSAADTVTVRFQNESGGTLDLASGILRARVEGTAPNKWRDNSGVALTTDGTHYNNLGAYIIGPLCTVPRGL